MQIISHKNTSLTICQRFFIEKSLELLHSRSIDSYRVKLHNPKTILLEIKNCLEDFSIGRIKYFNTIKSGEKLKKALIDEAVSLLKSDLTYIEFKSFTKEYFLGLLYSVNEYDYKKVISCIDIILKDNAFYIEKVIDGVQGLVIENSSEFFELEKLDNSLNVLYSELISNGFSKEFLSKLVYGIFVNSLKEGMDFFEQFKAFRTRLLLVSSCFKVIFRIDTTLKVCESISEIPGSEMNSKDNIDGLRFELLKEENAYKYFNVIKPTRIFITCEIMALDYLAALKIARSRLSEYLDVINLGLADEPLHIHHSACVIDLRSPEMGRFQRIINALDGSYQAEKQHYKEFTRKLPAILQNRGIKPETKEKIKSAIRYLRLGNQSAEVEHKFINYWIGLEYLFSNYESQNTINRIKDHFINAHLLAYTKRNTYIFKKDLAKLPVTQKNLIEEYTEDVSCLINVEFYSKTSSLLLNPYPLHAYRALKFNSWFTKKEEQLNVKDYLAKHKENLEIHFTRIYRLRNEIIHDAATNTGNEHIASNLRYYLTFILNEVIDFFSRESFRSEEKINGLSIDDYFILNEIKLGNIERSGYSLSDVLDIECSIDFISG